jgi:hypothetical protein
VAVISAPVTLLTTDSTHAFIATVRPVLIARLLVFPTCTSTIAASRPAGAHATNFSRTASAARSPCNENFIACGTGDASPESTACSTITATKLGCGFTIGFGVCLGCAIALPAITATHASDLNIERS